MNLPVEVFQGQNTYRPINNLNRSKFSLIFQQCQSYLHWFCFRVIIYGSTLSFPCRKKSNFEGIERILSISWINISRFLFGPKNLFLESAKDKKSFIRNEPFFKFVQYTDQHLSRVSKNYKYWYKYSKRDDNALNGFLIPPWTRNLVENSNFRLRKP